MEYTQVFNLDKFREENKFRLVINKADQESWEFFSGDAKEAPSLESGLQYKSYGDVLQKLNESGPIWRSTLSSITRGFGMELAGCIDIPIKPYLAGSIKPKFTVTCILPLVGDPKEDIYKPIATLGAIALPRKFKEQQTDQLIDGVADWVEDAFAGDTGPIWTSLKDALTGYIRDFLKDTYLLQNPRQFLNDVSIDALWGNVLYRNILIETIKVNYSKSFYNIPGSTYFTGGRESHPAYAEVVITFVKRNTTYENDFVTEGSELIDSKVFKYV